MKKFYSFLLSAIGLLMAFTANVSAQQAEMFQTYIIYNANTYRAGGINADGATAYNNTAFGTVTSLVLRGGEIKTYKNSGGNVSGAELFYNIHPASSGPGAFTAINLPFCANIGGAPFAEDQKWSNVANANCTGQGAGSNINVLAGLSPGTYKLEVYWRITTNVSLPGVGVYRFDSNFGNNFSGTFTVACPTAACAPGSYCNSGTCTPCPAGTYESGGVCMPCLAGTFNPVTGAVACQSCPPGKFSDVQGAVACQNCPAGTANPYNGASACIACAPGFYSNVVGSASCSACPDCDDSDPSTTDTCDPVLGCVNTPTSTVPTLGQWGLIIFGLLLLCTGAIAVWRRQFSLVKESV